MVRVFFTVDVEVWCDHWNDLDRQFAGAFARYIHGPTPRGDYGLPAQLRLLKDHGLAGVFFVEPLFAARFGIAPLQEIVGLVRAGGQDVQLHLHTEWVDEARETLMPHIDRKRQFLWMFSRDEQVQLIRAGAGLLERAGADAVCAFRAGNYGMSRDTWPALHACGLRFDSSYNQTALYAGSGLEGADVKIQPFEVDGVLEYPITVYRDGLGRYRHAQLGACSYRELEQLLWHAAGSGWDSVVIVSHSFELLNSRKEGVDDIVLGRFRKLCRMLDRHRDVFETSRFAALSPARPGTQPAPPVGSVANTGLRLAEQAWRRFVC